jgi:urease subunit gamma
MIYAKAMIKGEDDIPPYIRVFEYAEKSDESIFFEASRMIRRRLFKNLRINIHECLIIYLAYIIENLRAKKAIDTIEENARNVLSVDQVMIGVPESLKKIVFEIKIGDDNQTVRNDVVNIDCPFPTCKYILSPEC